MCIMTQCAIIYIYIVHTNLLSTKKKKKDEVKNLMQFKLDRKLKA